MPFHKPTISRAKWLSGLSQAIALAHILQYYNRKQNEGLAENDGRRRSRGGCHRGKGSVPGGSLLPHRVVPQQNASSLGKGEVFPVHVRRCWRYAATQWDR